MDTPIQVDLGRIAQDLQIRRVQVESVVQLLDEGNTVPFITRYRKERTGGLNEVLIREIQLRVGRLRELAERKETILKSIEGQGKLSEELATQIRAADNPKNLEDLYLPYKPKKKTKASDARERGLEPLALRIWTRDETLTDLNAAALEFINAEKEVETVEKVLEGVGHILAEAISEYAPLRRGVRVAVWKTGKIATTKGDVTEAQGLEYRDYFNYSEPIGMIPPHRVLAINRGDKEGPLKVKLEVSRPDLEAAVFSVLPLDGHPHADFFRAAAVDALDRLLLPSFEREVRRDLTDLAERHAVDVFARNLRSLLLQPPIIKQVVLAIDPGFRTGCKVAVLGPNGELLEHGVIHPHQPQNRRYEAKQFIKDLVGKHHVNVVAIGNGTACRETEELIAEVISEGTEFHAIATGTALPTPEATDSPTPVASEAAVESTPEPAHEAAHEVAPTEEAVAPEAEPLPTVSGGSGEDEPMTDFPAAPAPAEHAAPEPTEAAEPAPAEHEHEHETPAAEAVPQAVHAEATPVEEGAAAPVEAVPVEGTPVEGEASAAEAPAHTPQPRSEKPRKGDQGPRPPRPKPTPPPPPSAHPADAQIAQLSYVIVNEAGASVYSTSAVGREEFPEFDATLRGTVSIGRRLQDPLSELVKIEPQSIGVGLYQHDVNAKQLRESLDAVIASCVNFVGVDLNSASVPLLRYVSGLNQLTAKRVADYRKEHGPFTERSQITLVEGVGPATFTQSAGFLKIGEGPNPLDRTWVHPESYEAATKLLEKLEFGTDIIVARDRRDELHQKLSEADIPALAQELAIGEPTLRDIFDALARPERDPRDDLPKPIFKKGVLKLEDLSAGMELKGTVLNVVDFGAFVDIGLKDSGLVHISQLANRYIKSPHDVVSVGDVVSAWVMGVDQERKRVSLTMVKPGTERPRGPANAPEGGGGGGGRRGGGGPQQGERREQRPPGPGGDRRPPGGGPGRGAPTRPAPSSLPPSPVGSPPGPGGESSVPSMAPRPDAGRPPYRGGQGGPGGQGGGGRFGGGGGQGGQGRGPSRFGPGGGGQGGGRSAPPPRVLPPIKPAKPAPPPPPLSKDALTGSVPLRSFGQLKQLWQAKTDDDEPGGEPNHGEAPQAESSPEPPAN